MKTAPQTAKTTALKARARKKKPLPQEAHEDGAHLMILGGGLGLLALAGGGGSQTDGGAQAPQPITGFLIDSPVAGAQYYVNGLLRGTTGADGSFSVLPGETVSFKIGPITLAENVVMPADRKVYLQDLAGVERTDATDPLVVKLAQLLQTLDADNDPENGITLDAARLREGLEPVSIAAQTAVETLLAPEVELVSEAAALDHVNNNGEALKALDDTAPTATMSLDLAAIKAGETAVLTLEFSEPVQLFAGVDRLFTLAGGGVLTDLVSADGGRTYTATYTPATEQTAREIIALRADYTDLAGNQGGVAQTEFAVDSARPEVTITDSQTLGAANGPLIYTFRFNEPVQGFSADDIRVENGEKGLFSAVTEGADAGKVFTLVVTPEARSEGALSVSLGADWADLAGNAPAAETTSAPQDYDTIRPEIRLDLPYDTRNAVAGSTRTDLPNGRYVLTWTAPDAGGDQSGFAQLFEADGSPVRLSNGAFWGPQTIEALAVTTGTDLLPQVVAVGDAGAFALVWQGQSGAGDQNIYTQGYRASADFSGALTLSAPSGSAGDDLAPSVQAIGNTGDYVVAWQNTAQDGSSAVYSRRITLDLMSSTPSVAQKITAPEAQSGADSAPQITALGDGGYLLSWTGRALDGTASVFAQRFDAAGQGVEPVVLGAAGESARIVALAGGGFVWASQTAGETVVQSFGADDAALGASIVLAGAADIAPLAAGGFAVAYGAPQIALARFGAEGARDLAPVTVGAGAHPQVIGLQDGGFALAYETAQGVAVQRLDALGAANGAPALLGGAQSTGAQIAQTQTGFVVAWTDAGQSFSQGFDAFAQPQLINVTVNAADLDTATISVTGSERGTAYLVHSSLDLSALSAENASLWNSVELTSGGVVAALSTAGLADGDYQLILRDAAGNLSDPRAQLVKIDQTLPVLTISGNLTPLSIGGAAVYTLTFSEPVAGFSAEDVTVANGRLTSFIPATQAGLLGRQFTLVIAPNLGVEGDLGLRIGTDFADLAGNAPSALTQGPAHFVDTLAPLAPVVTLQTDSGVAGDKITNDGALNVQGEAGGTVLYGKSGRGPFTEEMPALTEGLNTIYIRQRDAIGNFAPTVSFSFTLDRQVATPTLSLKTDTGSADLITALAELSIGGVEANARVEYSADGATWTPQAPSAVPGANTVYVRQVDLAGNISAAQSLSYQFDREIAVPSLALAEDSGAADGITRNPQITVSGLETGADWAYSVDGGDWVAGSASSFNAVEGAHSYAVRQTDAAGNSAVSEAFTATLISQASPISAQLIGSDGLPIAGDVTADAGAVLRLSGAASDTWQYRFVSAAASAAAVAIAEPEWITVAGNSDIALREGRYFVETRKIDIANNFVSALTRVAVDTGALAPVARLAEDTGAQDGDTTNPLVRVTGLEPRATLEISVDGGAWSQSTLPDGQFALTLGTHSYALRQTDAAGNVSPISTYSYTYRSEISVPQIVLTDTGAQANDGITSVARAEVSGLLDGAVWQYRVDNGDWITGSGTGFDLVTDGGAHSYALRQQLGGTWSEPSQRAGVRVDSGAPSGISAALAADTAAQDGITNDDRLLLSGLEIGARLEIQIDGGAWRALGITGSQMELALQEGAHRYTIRQVDTAGNISPEITRDYTYLNAELAAPSLALAQDTATDGDQITAASTITVSGIGANATWQYQVDDGAWITGEGSSFTAHEGQHSYRLRQSDLAGNVSPISAAMRLTLDSAAPEVAAEVSARVADGDSEGAALIAPDTLLYTFTAPDAVSLSMAQNSVFSFDPATGALRFAQPMGYQRGGENAYSATLIATDAAGNASAQTVTIHIDRTNLATPQISLSEIRNGIETLNDPLARATYAPDGSLFYVVKDAAGNYYLNKLDSLGEPAEGFTPYPFETAHGSTITGSATIRFDAQGKINVVYMSGFNRSILLNADGTPDQSYGTNGVVTQSQPFPANTSISMAEGAVDTEGRTYFVGSASPVPYAGSAPYDSYVIVFNKNGTHLTSQRLDLAGGKLDFATKIVAGTDGAVYIVSTGALHPNSASTEPTDFVIQRFVGGQRDSAFGTLNLPATTAPNTLSTIATDPQGRLLISHSVDGARELTRLTPQGAVDTSFGVAGKLSLTGLSNERLQFMPEGDFYLTVTNGAKVELRHYTAAGLLDTSFAQNGVFAPALSNVQQFYVTAAGTLDVILAPNAASREIRQYTLTDGQPLVDHAFGNTALTYKEGNRPIGLLSSAASLSDADALGGDYAGYSLSIARKGGANTDDIFGGRGKLVLAEGGVLLWDGVEIGSYAGGTGALTLTFNAAVTAQNLDQIARAISYRNANPSALGEISLRWTFSDNDPMGAKFTTATQGLNLVNDNADLGIDPQITLMINEKSLALSNRIEVNGKSYYAVLPKASEGHNLLDTVFNGGADTTSTARSLTTASGAALKLLTAAEIDTLLASDAAKADGFWSSILQFKTASNGERTAGVWAADLGAREGQHLAKGQMSGTNFTSTSDSYYFAYYGIVEATPETTPTPDYVAPALKLLVDNGEFTDDRLTSDGRMQIIGLSSGLPYELSLDGGKTWTPQPSGSTMIDLPAGTYALGAVQVRQTDLGGFTETITSTASYKIDKNIKAIGLYNDQGLSIIDGKSVDGRVALSGISDDLPYEYSVDGGATWTQGGTLTTGVYGFTLTEGVYAQGSLRVRQTDAEGVVTSGRNSAALVISPTDGQGILQLTVDNGESATDRISSDDRLTATGLVANIATEFSLDGGASWTALPASTTGSTSFSVPQGTYAAGAVLLRQVDAKGTVTTLSNPQSFAVDKTVKDLSLLNDQGLSVSDGLSADGRMLAQGLDLGLGFEISRDGGASWSAGSYEAGRAVFSLENGAYASGAVQVRQTLPGGLVSVVKTTKAISVGAGQGAITLAEDTGVEAADGLTNLGRLGLTGLRGGLAWEYSLDGGATWGAGAIGATQSLTLPEGSYLAGQIRARQTDASGFTTVLASTKAITVDLSISGAALTLLADTGYSNTDQLTADGRLHLALTGALEAGDTWSYSLDSGKTWRAGAGGETTITLADGRYPAKAIQLKVVDAAGNASLSALDKPLVVDTTDSAAPLFTSAVSAVAVDPDGTGSATKTDALMTITTTDANTVYYSLSGADADLFTINDRGQISFTTATNLSRAAGDNFALTVTATDAFGNAAQQAVTLVLAAPFSMVSRSPSSEYDAVDGRGFVMRFSHDIVLDPAAVVKIISPYGAFADIIVPQSDLTVAGDTLTLAVSGLTAQTRYTVELGSAVRSALTQESYVQPKWSGVGFTLDQSVRLTYDNRLTSEGGQVLEAPAASATGRTAVLGDVNGDGIDDFAVSYADGDSLGRGDNGVVYIVYGGSAVDLSAVAQGIGGYVISGAVSNGFAGAQVAAAGDINGDGLADIALHNGNGTGTLVYGARQSAALDLAALGARGRSYSYRTADSFGGIDDVNGDGYDDLAHGTGDLNRSTFIDTVTVSKSRFTTVYTIVQKADWLNYLANWVDAGMTAYSFFDDPLAATIETGAEYRDALDLAFAEAEDDPMQDAVKDAIYQVWSGLNHSTQEIVSMTTTQTGGGGGGGIFEAPPKDTVVTLTFTIETTSKSVWRQTTTLYGSGETVVDYGGLGGTSAQSAIIGTINSQQIGADIRALGDINGDGRADYGVLDMGSGGVLARLNVVYGKGTTSDLFTNNFDQGIGGFRISDSARSAEYAEDGTFTGLGDINGDGFTDFALTLDEVHAATYIVYGRAGMSSVDLAQVAAGNGGFKLANGSRASNTWVDAIGDFNGDGLDDFVAYESGRGAVHKLTVIYGSAAQPALPTFWQISDETLGYGERGFTVEASYSTAGFAERDAVSAGDLNGDGLTDLTLRGSAGDTILLMGSTTSGSFAQIDADQLGSAGADLLVSGGQELLVGLGGADQFVTKGADVVLAGAGDDRITLAASTVSALQSAFGAGGNSAQLAKIEGGAGLDTLVLSEGITLDFTRIGTKALEMDNVSGRVSGIEVIDMQSDSAANTLKLTLADVLEIGSSNAFNTLAGWSNLSGGALSAQVDKTQLAVLGTAADRVELRAADWSATGSVVSDGAQSYAVYHAANGAQAQLLIDRDAGVSWA